MKPGELKPCPFCGCLPLGRNVGWTEGDRFRVECVSEECNVLPATHPAETPAIAAHWWNTRICRRLHQVEASLTGDTMSKASDDTQERELIFGADYSAVIERDGDDLYRLILAIG